jgi:hypothetical protein
MQGRIPTYKKSEYSKHTKEKTLHIEFYVQKYGRKKYFYLKKYSPLQSTKGKTFKYL